MPANQHASKWPSRNEATDARMADPAKSVNTLFTRAFERWPLVPPEAALIGIGLLSSPSLFLTLIISCLSSRDPFFCVCISHPPLFTMRISRSFGLLSLLLLARSARAIEVVADSPCGSLCINNGNVSDPNASSTQHEELYCLDSHYAGGSDQESGAFTWSRCLTCESTSSAYAPGIHNDTELDTQMFLCKLTCPAVVLFLPRRLTRIGLGSQPEI